MPSQFEDTHADISGDPPPPRPLSQKQMVGAQKQTVNRTQLGAQPKAGGATSGERSAGKPPTGADGKPDAQSQDQAQPKDDTAGQPQLAQGIGPAWTALVDGIGAIQKDPAWMEHPLLRILADPSGDPSQMGQDLWTATRWWGNVVNAAFDVNAMHASQASIEHDNSFQGKIAQTLFGIHNDPVSEFAWNAIPYVFAAGAEWQPWMWGPAVAAGGPQELKDLPQAMMSLFGNDLRHPEFSHPDWYARMGSYILAGAIAAKGGGKAAAPLIKFTGRLKALEPFANHADRMLGGPGEKTPIKGPDGVTYDPNIDPDGHAYAQWWNDNVSPVQEKVSPIGKASQRPQETLVRKPMGEGGDQGYVKMTTEDPAAKKEFARKMGLPENATPEEMRDKLSLMAEEGELSPSLSRQILDNWDRWGPAVEMWGKFKYYHGSEADFHNALETMRAIPDQGARESAFNAMRAANGFHADLHAGVHSYGNELLESLTKGVLSHSRSTDHYGGEMLTQFEKVLSNPAAGARGKIGVLSADRQLRDAVSLAIEDPYLETDAARQTLKDRAYGEGGVAEKQRALEELNRLEGGEGARATRYDQLSEQGKWAHDFYRRLVHEVSEAKMKAGVPGFSPQPNMFYRVTVDVKNLEKSLSDIPEDVRGAVRSARGRTPFGRYHHEHRAVVLKPGSVGDPTAAEGAVSIRNKFGEEKGAPSQLQLHVETAGKTTAESNAARDIWREQMKLDLIERSKANPKLAVIVNDARKFNALLQAELPRFSTDPVDSMRAMLRDVKDLHTHQVMEEAKRTLVLDPKTGDWHPLALARDEAGQESSPALSAHFKDLHSADTTTDFYSTQMGYRSIQGLSSGGYIFHPRFAEPINRLYDLHKGEGDAIYGALRKLSAGGKHVIMLNPMWHAVNMAGRFAWLMGTHPVGMAQSLMKAKGVGAKMSHEDLQLWWDAQERELYNHGGVTPQLHEDVTQTIGRNQMMSTGDIEVGQPLDVKAPINGFKGAAADALNAVKGVDAWYQNHINDRFWNQYRQFHTLAYIVLKDDAIKRGMGTGDARIFAASQANRWSGMTTPDRWAQNPFMYKASQLGAFAPNWWRTYPGLFLGTYDRMGLKSNPALTHAWALNSAKAVGAMFLVKAGTDNALNYLMSGHWQTQNPDGYKQQITMDRFFPTDTTTGAHHVMEDPFQRQPHDLLKALGLDEAMKYGQWKPEYAEQGVAEVLQARVSPLVQAIESASNFDLYNTIKQGALKWVDPSHPGFLGSANAAVAGAANTLTPWGYTMQAALAGATAQDGTLNWGPLSGTKIPGWAMRAFAPNEPISGVMSLLGVRGGYPAPIRSDERGLSSDEQRQLAKYRNDFNEYMQKQQAAVMSGGMTWSDWAYNYKQHSRDYFSQVRGLTNGTSQYMQGADGLLSQYEAIYGDKTSFDANGDIDWKAVQKAQDQFQAKVMAEPGGQATWRQMMALKDQREMHYPVLRAYKDSLQNYRNFQDTQAKQQGIDGEQLRSLIAQAAGSPDFRRFEAAHPELQHYYAAKREWELNSKQGFAYGLFTNNSYVMRIVAPGGTQAEVTAAEQTILPQIEAAEKAGSFVTPSGQ